MRVPPTVAGMSTSESWFADNRANWDDRAAVHEASGYGIEALVADPEHLSVEVAQDRERLGDLAGLDVVHLQCHLGTDTVGLSRLGAQRTVGVDLSPRVPAPCPRHLPPRRGGDRVRRGERVRRP